MRAFLKIIVYAIYFVVAAASGLVADWYSVNWGIIACSPFWHRFGAC